MTQNELCSDLLLWDDKKKKKGWVRIFNYQNENIKLTEQTSANRNKTGERLFDDTTPHNTKSPQGKKL